MVKQQTVQDKGWHQIAIKTVTYERLIKQGTLADSFDSVVNRLLDCYEKNGSGQREGQPPATVGAHFAEKARSAKQK